MTQVKAVARLEGIRGTDQVPDGVATYTIIVSYIGLDPAQPPVTDDLLISSIAASSTPQDVQKLIEDAVRAALIADGFTFDPQDAVQVYGI